MTVHFRTNDNLVVGRNAVIELIKSNREIENILVAKGEREGSISKIIALAKEKGIVIKNVDRKKLDFISAGANHQGVAANVPAHEYSSVDDILEFSRLLLISSITAFLPTTRLSFVLKSFFSSLFTTLLHNI